MLLYSYDTRWVPLGLAEGCDRRRARPHTYGGNERSRAFYIQFSNLLAKSRVRRCKSPVASILGVIRAGHTSEERTQLVRALWKSSRTTRDFR